VSNKGYTVAVTADLHATNNLYLAKPTSEGYTDRLLDVNHVLDIVLSDKSVIDVLILGDLYHNRLLDAPTLKKIGRTFEDHGDKNIYILPGNHDAHDAFGQHYNVDYLDNRNINVLNEGDALEFSNTTLIALPYLPDRKAKEIIQQLRGDVLLCHQSFVGCRNNGWVNKFGIEVKDYDHFNYVLSGHFHESQEFHKGMYVGSPLPLSFQESNNKGYWLITFDNGQVIHKEFQPIKSPEFRTTEIKGCHNAKGLLEVLEALAKDKVYVHLHIIVNAGDVNTQKAALNTVSDKLPENVRMLTWTITQADTQKAIPTASEMAALPTIESMLDKYMVEVSGLSDEDKKQAWQIGMDILGEARS